MRNLSAVLILATALTTIPTPQASPKLTKEIRKFFDKLTGRDRKKKEDKEVVEEQTARAEAAGCHDCMHNELDKAIAAVESASIVGTGIYSLLINNAINTVLDDAEGYVAKLRWGAESRFLSDLAEMASTEQARASLLLQIKIVEAYFNSDAPLMHFIQDLTVEKMELGRYQKAITELATNDSMHRNEALTEKIHAMVRRIEQRMAVIDGIYTYTIILVKDLFEPLNPPQLLNRRQDGRLYRLIEQSTESAQGETFFEEAGPEA